MDDRFKFRTPIFSIENEFCGFQYSEIKGNRLKITGYSGIVEINEFLNFGKIEQCTGLNDKNGKLIYEGDIIWHDTVAGPKHWAVEFKNGCFVLAYESGDAWLMKVIEHCPYCSGVVVAGNIHENPELLEEKNENS